MSDIINSKEEPKMTDTPEAYSEKIAPPVGSDAPGANEARRDAYAAARDTPFADPVLPDGPYLTPDGDDLSEAGRTLIEKSVMAGNTQDLVAKQLGLKPVVFAKKINRTGSPFHNAWRFANAELDSAYLRRQTYRALVLRSPDAIAFGLRQRGFSERTAPSTTVNVAIGDKIALVPAGTDYSTFVEFQKSMALEGKTAWGDSFGEAEYMKKIGQVTDAPRVITDKSQPSCDDAVGEELTAVNPDE